MSESERSSEMNEEQVPSSMRGCLISFLFGLMAVEVVLGGPVYVLFAHILDYPAFIVFLVLLVCIIALICVEALLLRRLFR